MPFERRSFDEVHPGHGIPRHSLLAHSGRGHYEAALVLIEEHQNGIKIRTHRAINAWPSIILLMEQSIEMLMKALLLINDPTLDVRKYGHGVMKMIEIGGEAFPEFAQFKAERDCLKLLEGLEAAYNSLRYGEDWSSIKREKIIEAYVKIVSTLLHGYSIRTGIRL